MSEHTITMRNVRPFWGRVTVLESPVDEEQRESGLIVPIQDARGDTCKRGIIREIDGSWDDPRGRAMAELIGPGTPVYYRGGEKIGDLIILELQDILAYEDGT